MAIFHDAWLFDPRAFGISLLGRAHAVADDSAVGYGAVRAFAIDSLDNSNNGWFFVERYGGWDRASVLSELPDQAMGDSVHIAHCFTLLLYSHLANENSPRVSVGLNSEWRITKELLINIGWDASVAEMSIKGREFGDFAENYLMSGLTSNQLAATRRIWSSIRPASTASWVGWLDRKDASLLMGRLVDADIEMSSLKSAALGVEVNLIRILVSMFQAATESDRGLCLILSG